MASDPAILANGQWSPDQIDVIWRDDRYLPADDLSRQADAKIEALRERGSPSHDGLAARLVQMTVKDDRLELELQPARWSLRLVEHDTSNAVSSLCIVRRADGAWLAGRRALWLSTWAGRWALGAGGAVEVGENPADTLSRELLEEWSLVPERLDVRVVVRNPSTMILVV